MKKERKFLHGISLSSQENKQQVAIFKRSRIIISLIAGVLGIYYGYLQLSGLEVEPLITDSFADALIKIALFLYYLAWVYGLLMDLKDEEAIFILPPNKGKYTISAYFSVLAIAIVFFSLCYFKSNQIFTLILDAFIIINIITWQYLINFISESVKDNKEFYNTKKKHFQSVYLRIFVDDYLKGIWQWWRFGVDFFILIILNLLVFSDLSQIISTKFNLRSVEFVKTIGFIVFLAISEGWIWYMRLKRRTSLDLIDSLDEEYYLMKRHS